MTLNVDRRLLVSLVCVVVVRKPIFGGCKTLFWWLAGGGGCKNLRLGCFEVGVKLGLCPKTLPRLLIFEKEKSVPDIHLRICY